MAEVLSAGIEEICLVVTPGDEMPYREVAGPNASRLHFVQQTEARGYGHAVYCTRQFVGNAPFLHLVGDHLYVSRSEKSCAQHLVDIASVEACTVSAVQATRESLLPYFGAIGARRLAGRSKIYQVETVIEKPTPTTAEQHLMVPGLRAGHYLCFFGMHVLTPTIMEVLQEQIEASKDDPTAKITLSAALATLAKQEQYLALEKNDLRYDVGVKYGLLTAQLALALSGQEREEVMAKLLELLVQRESVASAQSGNPL
jgi:UTP--glucose-1-phosphate uridylyltransferase